MLKVIFIFVSMGDGGAERTAINLIKTLPQYAIAPRLGLIKNEGDSYKVSSDRLVTINESVIEKFLVNSPIYKMHFIHYILRIRHIINKEKPDIVMSYEYGPHFATFFALKGLGKRKPAWIIRDGSNAAFSLQNNWKYHFLPTIYGAADGIIAISEGVRHGLVNTFGVSAKKIQVILNPVDLDEIQRESTSCCEILPKRRFLVAAGRLDHQKGFDLLIKAYKDVAAAWDVDLLILGQGPLKASLETQIAELGLQNRVFLLGFQRNPWPFFAAAEAFIMSSRHEGFAHVIVEALACQTPVISSDCDYGPKEILQDGECGLLYPRDNIEALRDAILRLLSDEPLRKKLIDSGFNRAQDFDISLISSQYASYLKQFAPERND
jgi:glycosyltransferase involved in cell wall biosynthesis